MTDSVLTTSGFACPSCGTELGAGALACPSCRTLVYANDLRQLAAEAESRGAAGDLAGSREAWSQALMRLPPGTQQHDAISQRVQMLDRAMITRAPAAQPKPAKRGWRQGLAGIGGAVLVGLSKLKFLIFGLTKLSTLLSMVAFFGLYWAAFGWPLALGFVISIYIHEMGHVAELRRLGISAGAPLFIPGLGALVRLRQRVDDPVTDARIGLAGPVWGLGAGIAAWLVAMGTHSPTWFAIAQLTGYVNLFNLIPIWQLDGSRGFHALDRAGRWTIVVAAGVLFAVTHEKMLAAIAIVAAYRAFQRTPVGTDRRTLLTFATLLATLSALASIDVGIR